MTSLNTSHAAMKSEPSSPVAGPSKKRHQSTTGSLSDEEVVVKKPKTEGDEQKKDKGKEKIKKTGAKKTSPVKDIEELDSAGSSRGAVKKNKRKWTLGLEEEKVEATGAVETVRSRTTKKAAKKVNKPVICDDLCDVFSNLGIVAAPGNLEGAEQVEQPFSTEERRSENPGDTVSCSVTGDKNPFTGVGSIFDPLHERALPQMKPPELTCVASSHAVISEDQLTEICSVFDRPCSVSLLHHRRTSCRTIALVEYGDLEAVERALTLSGRARVNRSVLYVERLRDY